MIKWLVFIIVIIFITPWGYIHYPVLLLLLPFLFFFSKKKLIYDFEALLLALFSFLYVSFLYLNQGLDSGIGTLIKYLCVPLLIYRAGKAFVDFSKDDIEIINNLFLILFFFSIIVFISIAKDVSKIGFITTNRNLAIIGQGDELINATGINSMISVWLVMIAFLFHKTQVGLGFERKFFILSMSSMAVASTFRLGSRTGLVLICSSCIVFFIYNFNQYNAKNRLKLISFFAVIVSGIAIYIASHPEIFFAYLDRSESKAFGVSSAGGRSQAWSYYIGLIPEYPLGGMPFHGFAHNYFIDIARISGIFPLLTIIFFTFSALLSVIKILNNKNRSLVMRNLFLVLNVGFYLVFMVEPVIEGCFNLFILYLFTCGVINRVNFNSRLDKKTISRNMPKLNVG